MSDTTDDAPGAPGPRRYRLDRWSGGLAAAAALAAAGVLTGTASLVAGAAVPVVYAALGAISTVGFDPADLAVERTLGSDVALPGERVAVRLELHNAGDRTVTDLRVVDAVPDDLRVVEGAPRAAMTLAPGERATVAYSVVATRGDHDFGPVGVRARGVGGGEVVSAAVDPGGETTLDCTPAVETPSLARRTLQFVGATDTAAGGDGVEFHSTRKYRRGDPLTRVDWRRLARSGELTTVDFREEAAARLLVLVDGRAPAHLAPLAGAPTGAAVAADAGRRLLAALSASGHQVGAAALGVPAANGETPAVVRPGTGEETRLRATTLLETAGTHPSEREPTGVEGPGTEHTAGTGPVSPSRSASPSPDGGRPLEAGRSASGGGSGPARERSSTAERSPGASDDAASPVDGAVGRLCEGLPAATQVLFLTPALDDGAAAAVRTARAHDASVTVISPDVTTGTGAGDRLAAVERAHRLDACRAAGARVVDWDRERSLSLALAAAVEGVR